MDLPFRRLEPERVDALDSTFQIRSRHAVGLRESIERNGIRTPLILEPTSRDVSCELFRIVSGWGRWLYRPEKARLPAFILPEGMPLEGVWDVFLRDNDAWNAMEVARILRGLERVPGLTVERVVRDKLPLLGVHASQDLHRRYLRLLDLGPDAQRFIEEEGLPLRRAAVFFKLPSEAVESVLGLAGGLRLTLNELGEVLELLEEVARRDGVSAAQLVDEIEVHGRLDKEKVKAKLRERRYPELSRYRERLRGLEKELSFSVPVRIEWDQRLERPGIHLVADLAEEDAIEVFERELSQNRAALRKFFEVL